MGGNRGRSRPRRQWKKKQAKENLHIKKLKIKGTLDRLNGGEPGLPTPQVREKAKMSKI